MIVTVTDTLIRYWVARRNARDGHGETLATSPTNSLLQVRLATVTHHLTNVHDAV